MSQSRERFSGGRDRQGRTQHAGNYTNHYIRNSLTAILGYSISGNYEKVEEIVMSLIEHFENTGVLLRKEEQRSEYDDETRLP